MGRPKKQKVNVNELEQTHGALASPKPVSEIMGYGSDYNTSDISAYSAELNKMSDIDLHDHSVKIGVVPIRDRYRLISKLEERFLLNQSKYIYRNVPVKLSKEAEENQKKFMRPSL